MAWKLPTRCPNQANYRALALHEIAALTLLFARKSEPLRDNDGTDLIDLAAARDHAAGVARELTFKGDGLMEQRWSNWTMRVHDDQGVELFFLAMSDFQSGNS
jgi:uncharacterized protein DUF6894